MMPLAFELRSKRDRLGLKGPRAAEWLMSHGIVLPMAPNTWTSPAVAAAAKEAANAAAVAADAAHTALTAGARNQGGAATNADADALLVARLGATEFFLEDSATGTLLRDIAPALYAQPTGVYPVLREDCAFLLTGAGVDDVLAQVCNVNFAGLALQEYPLIMTMMIGVAVLVIPRDAVRGREYLIWCDPTFGHYLGESLRTVVIESGGSPKGVSA